MPWINGRFYANPLFGRALEQARAAEAGRIWSEDYPELEFEQQPSSQQDSANAARGGTLQDQRQNQHDQHSNSNHWVTIDGRHVLIHEAQGNQRHHQQPTRRPLPSSGQASIYADRFDGQKSSNGDIFHQDGYTAALLPRDRWHAVPLGTRVEVTHGDNRVVVEINDRGAGDKNPQSARALDLSRAAASALTGRSISDDDDANMVGLIKLDKIRVVPVDTPLGPVQPRGEPKPGAPGARR